MKFCFHPHCLRTRWGNRGQLHAGTEFIFVYTAAQKEAHFFWKETSLQVERCHCLLSNKFLFSLASHNSKMSVNSPKLPTSVLKGLSTPVSSLLPPGSQTITSWKGPMRTIRPKRSFSQDCLKLNHMGKYHQDAPWTQTGWVPWPFPWKACTSNWPPSPRRGFS